MPLPITHVYEVVDATDDERYYALGLYIDEKAAIETLDVAEPPRGEDWGDDSVTIQVRKRRLGWNPHGHEIIAKRTWTREWPSDENAAPTWKCNPPRPHSFA